MNGCCFRGMQVISAMKKSKKVFKLLVAFIFPVGWCSPTEINLQIPSHRLFSFYRFKQSFEISFAKTFRTLTLNDLKE